MGAWLAQARDRVIESAEPWADGARVRPCKSTAVIFFARADRLAAVGAGQMNRVAVVNVAVFKAGGELQGTLAASDAFFQFRDGLDATVSTGANAVVPTSVARSARHISCSRTCRPTRGVTSQQRGLEQCSSTLPRPAHTTAT